LDLFAGCGGLALGFEAAGFQTVGYEKEHDACATYNRNLRGVCHEVALTSGLDLIDRADVIIGGPPCQPFSVGGLQQGRLDSRNGFPIFLDAIERYQPKVAVFENVRGMFYRSRGYLNEIINAFESLKYRVEAKILHAVGYGVPQRRERLFVVAHRGNWRLPKPIDKHKPFTSGEALGELALTIPHGAKFLTASMDEYVAKYEAKSKCIRPRDLHLDQPSRTVTCRNLSGATGDMMRIRLGDGRRRRLTVREGARLQSFPDWFDFVGTQDNQFNQIGNAVPPLLAKAVAKSVLECLDDANKESEVSQSDLAYRQAALHF
jgi:site-specific DNA-cytosine methylase